MSTTWAFIASILIPITLAHVRLMFPTARYPMLDFLDAQRTPAPCGVAKPFYGVVGAR